MTHTSIPSDADGDAIRRLLNDGSSVDRPMTIDFHIAAPNEAAANAIAAPCYALGYRVSIGQDADRPTWTVTCTARMLLTHAAVIAMQDELHAAAAAYGGKADGWGSFGNPLQYPRS